MKAIETRYKGYRFRSRLEARWAVFLDSLCVPWDYEKEGFEFPGRQRYLPDFWLPRQQAWMEVKGERGNDGWEVAFLLAQASGKHVVIVHGDFCPVAVIDPLNEHRLIGHGHCWYGDNRHTWPTDPDPVAWAECPNCGFLGFGLWGLFPNAPSCPCKITESGWIPHLGREPGTWHPDSSPRILRAYTAARSARFEHGESPL